MMENFDDEFGDLSGYKILSFEEVTQGFEGNKNPLKGIVNKSFEEIFFDKKFGEAGGNDKCAATKGDFYSENMNLSTLWNDLSNRTNDKFFFYYQNYALSNPSTTGGISPTVLTSTSTTYTPSKFFEYSRGNENKSALISVELNKRACFISLKNLGSVFYLNPEKQEIEFRLEFVYTDYLDKRNFNDSTDKYELKKEYNAVIVRTSDAYGYVALSEKLGLRNDAKNEIVTLFTEKVKETQDPAALKFLYENMPDFVIESLLSKLDGKFNNEIILTKDKKTGKTRVVSEAQKFLWGHLEKLVNYDDQGAFSWAKDSSGALLNLLKVFKNSQFLFESFKGNQTTVKRIFENMNATSVVDGREWSNKTLFANFITALCIDNAFEGLRILDKEFTIGNDYAISSGSVFQGEKDNEFFLQQMQKVTKTVTVDQYDGPYNITTTSLEDAEKGNLYQPMDIVRIKFADIKSEEQPFPSVSAMTIKAYAEERDQQLRADAVRIGFDVLAIVLGVVFFPAGGAVGIAAESIGIGLALADIGITANREDIEQSPGGKEFLDTWNKIYLVGGLALASAAIVEQVFAKSVFCYLEALKSGSPLLQAYEKSLGKILLQREILTFAGNTLKPNTEISLKILAYNSDKIPKATAFAFGRYENLLPLYKAGAVVVEIGEKEYALVYKGERILQDFYNEKWTRSFYRELKKSFRIPEQLEAKLENFYKLIPKLSDDRKFWTCFNDAGTELRWANETQQEMLTKIEKLIQDAKPAEKLMIERGSAFEKLNTKQQQFLTSGLEAEVAKEFSKYDKLLSVSNPVYKVNKDIAGEFDGLFSKYLVEVKYSVAGDTNTGKFLKQFKKYTDPLDENFINVQKKPVVLFIKQFTKGGSVDQSVLKTLQQNREIKVIVITDFKQIKKLY
ncbi:hypothetical protein [uncultured Chryseobacterium sp.]|uniref:hypothetical protein n=2 Tax=Chryseobacterium TaxID=59732 RepID=UPI002582D379|nr:hypothetical protein [uncultured Chryseobacterium sp.]